MLGPSPAAGRRWLLISLVLYLALRILALASVAVLEDRDSTSLIRDAQVFASWDAARIIDLRPDATPLYPLLTAVANRLGMSWVFGARFVSWLAAALLALAMTGIALRLAPPDASGPPAPERSATARSWTLHVAAAGVAVMALSPTLVDLSRSVLTEGLYIAVVYGGLWLLLRRGAAPSRRGAMLLGTVFALAFLARTEGLLYLAAVPVIRLATAWSADRGSGGRTRWVSSTRTWLSWSAAYVLGFGLLALPQVWRVSRSMGQPAFNGRQVWQVILNQPGDKPYEQKIYGLDHSPYQINLVYIQSHPEQARLMAGNVAGSDLVAKAAGLGRGFLTRSLPRLISPLGLLLAALGLMALWQARRRADLAWMGLFLGASLAAPLLHDLDPRHLAVSLPVLALLQGIGLVWLAGASPPGLGTPLRPKVAARPRVAMRAALTVAALAGLLLGMRKDLALATWPPPESRDYAMADQQALLTALRQADWPKPVDGLRITARQGYFSLAAGAQEVYLPFADYEALVTYCRFNQVDVLLLEHDLLERYPFLPRFAAESSPDFIRVHRHVSPSHGLLELYRFSPRGDGS